ncbi:S9 family peptidase [Xylella fastidiosa subsp. morus]|uniref:S9 family peptidase n=1 Tax=Xylella fastidiosa TaxID=2371 RepID=UPI0003ECEDB2|nr:S9 family peptidase [Xylella fastidiosa]AIC12597.1 peptidase S9 [Xylella fastidiosa MUL0034]EWG15352.1 alanyl dipeptidyl peptidase [Xylella fastidiosa Mul-MD]UIN28786.1 S9 family peptidase [Xylella fastidiosa subsp. morus]UIT37527.1 S9 family peptidase [Xylella fastidiosa subsp. morus]UIT39822.1 S9 family peptidase [Xylella fastidiosa subsp. morus]
MKLRYALPLCLLFVLPALAAARGFDVRDMVALDRVSSPELSPDGAVLVFAKRQMDAKNIKASTSVWVKWLQAGAPAAPVRLTPLGWDVSAPVFSRDGKAVYFLSAKSGSNQLYVLPVSGRTPRQLTNLAVDIDSYKLSPQGDRVVFSASVFQVCGSDLSCTKRKLDEKKNSKASGVVFEQLFVRHWDTWNDGRRNTLFIASLPRGGAKPVSAVSAMSAMLDGDVPSKPFGGADHFVWSPDGHSVVASIRVAGRQEPWSTNFDLYRFDVSGHDAPVNLTAANPAWDATPMFSADGKMLYYRAMRRPGFEADRFGLMEMEVQSGKVREIAPHWDRSADEIALSADGKALYVNADDHGEHPLFKVDIVSGKVEKWVGEGSVHAPVLAGGKLAFARNSLKSADQIFVTDAVARGPLQAITSATGEVLQQVRLGDFEQFSFKGWNDETVYGYVVKPYDYQPGKKYPVAFLIHGGPQGSFGNSWGYRWNPQTYAGQGYAVVMIDFHGSTGYGQAFTDAITQHWGDRPLEDLQKGWAAAQQQYPFLNGDKACALGASYGGYMVYWIAGHWNQPWKCLVDHDGVFDNRMMGYATEELWFSEWENGGTPWENPAGYEQFNPVLHVDKWRVPMLVIHGQKDFRIPVEQGLAAFGALQRKGIESKLLYFHDENHWVLKPQNSIQWHDTVNAWLKKYIGQ